MLGTLLSTITPAPGECLFVGTEVREVELRSWATPCRLRPYRPSGIDVRAVASTRGVTNLADRRMMAATCTHLDTIRSVEPSGDGCLECLQTGSRWVHLRRCTYCGHVGCCDSSPNKHATKHFVATRHPIVQSFEPGE